MVGRADLGQVELREQGVPVELGVVRDPAFAGLQVVDDLFGVGALELGFVLQVGATQPVESFRLWLRLVVGQEAALVD